MKKIVERQKEGAHSPKGRHETVNATLMSLYLELTYAGLLGGTKFGKK